MSNKEIIPQLGITKEEFAELLEKCSRSDIAVQFGISPRTLERIVSKHGLKKENAGPKNISEETVKEIRQAHTNGKLNQRQLAEKYGLSQSLICKIVNNQIHKDKDGNQE